MYLDRPHMRYDGIYVSRNTYIKVWPVPHVGQTVPYTSDIKYGM